MNLAQLIIAGLILIAAVAIVLLTWQFRRRHLQYWLGSYLRQARRRAPRRGERVHVLLCIADHYEPNRGNPSAQVVRDRVETWVSQYPRLFDEFRDSDGRPPQHTFFFPIDQYDPEQVDALAQLCCKGYGEVEIHLHHDHDTAANLSETLDRFVRLFVDRHGLLARRRDNGRACYGFIHGNWALDNSMPDGRWCGVNNELTILRQTGCYADFTLPSAPSPTQTRKINSIYYAIDDPRLPKSHDWGIDVGESAAPPPDGLMMIQGPLLLWRPSGCLLPRIENGCIQRSQPPSMARLDEWLRSCVQVRSRPDWFFVKLHTHGASESNQQVLLGESMVEFHRSLMRRAAEDDHFHVHYVTAREMYNLAKAAEAGWSGPVKSARDFELLPPTYDPGNNLPLTR
jgi:hypothetical protein